jgi:hypothetical protein
MSIICKRWVELRELPGSEHSEMFYIKLQDIERISFIEISPHEIQIRVFALGEQYHYNIVETMREAQSNAKALIEDIESSKNSNA